MARLSALVDCNDFHGSRERAFSRRRAASLSNLDTIADFSVAADTIRRENATFTAIVGTGTLTADQFTATDSAHRIVYETDTGKLFYDTYAAPPAAACGSRWWRQGWG